MSARLELKHFSVGNMDNNVYIVVDPETKDSILFDAPFDANRILTELRGTNLRAILMTHSDYDHVQALDEVRKATGAPVGVHALDEKGVPGGADFKVEDGQALELGSISVKVLHTPGHTPGSVSYVVGDMLMSGDTLFPGGTGNTQRPGGSFETIIAGVRDKLFTLPEETPVYPGHGASTTIEAEKPHLAEWAARGW